MINTALVVYAWNTLSREGAKSFFIFCVMSLLVALLASTLFLSNSMKREYQELINSSADISIINQKAMRDVSFKESDMEAVLEIDGVSEVLGRVEGYYKYEKANRAFLLFGIDPFESYSDPLIERLKQNNTLDARSMMLSSEVFKILRANYYEDYFNFIQEDGVVQKVSISKVFDAKKSSRLMLMPKALVREIFHYDADEITAMDVRVKNEEELALIARKIQELFVNAKVVLKKDREVLYERLYNLRSGFFLTIFTVSFFTFFIIIYDKMSGVSSEQKREIGILKALGWRIEDLLQAKLYEGIIISLSAYLVGIALSLLYVFLLKAPYLKAIFLNNYNLLYDYEIRFVLDYEVLVLLFFLSIPLYILASIIPSWRVASIDADEVMR